MGNKINVLFTKGSTRVTSAALWQYDYGQTLIISGLDLPAAYEVHFGNDPDGSTTTSIGDENGVAIPDAYLRTGAPVYAWLYLHTGEEDGETVYEIEIPVRKRAAITDQQPTPIQQDAITQAIAALDAAVEEAEGIAAAIPETIDAALQEAKDSGEFKGDPGEDGQDGQDGSDGFSPTATVSKSGTVTTVSITDKNGTTSAEINDGAAGSPGAPGKDGADGADGFSPSASVSKTGDTATITITDKTGTTTAQVKDGTSASGVQWELIREDSQTNATEADIVIDTDSNGNPFELTDIRLSFWTPVQDVQSGKGDYGRINFFNGETNLNSFYCGAWTQNAGTTAKICEGEIIQEGGMVETTFSKVQNDTVDAQILGTMRIGTTGAKHFLLPNQPHVYTKVVITKVTGTGAYRLYGKRKPAN